MGHGEPWSCVSGQVKGACTQLFQTSKKQLREPCISAFRISSNGEDGVTILKGPA